MNYSLRRKLTKWLTACAVFALAAAALSGCGSTAVSERVSSARPGSVTTYSADADAGYVMPEEEVLSYDDSANSVSASGASGGTLDGMKIAEAGEETGQKLIKSVDMNLETTDFDALIDTLQTRTAEMGGYIQSEEVDTSAENAMRWSYMVIRIPEECLEEFLTVVGENANVTRTNESLEDVTLQYVDLETHIDELRTEQKTLESLLADAESIEDIIAIQEQLTEIRYEIESYESQLKVLENRVDYSTVYLYINEVERETSAEGTTFAENVRTRFGDSIYVLRNGLRRFAVGFLGSILIILFAAVIVIVILLIVWGCVHRSRKLKGVPTRAMKRKRLRADKRERKQERELAEPPKEITADRPEERSEGKPDAKTEEHAEEGSEEPPAEGCGDASAEEAGDPPEEETGDAPEESGDPDVEETGDAPEKETGDAPEEETGDAPEEEPPEEHVKTKQEEFDERWYDPDGPYA